MITAVLGSLPFPGQGGDRIVSKAVSAAIATLFRHTDQLDATVRAEPVAKLLQGSVDSFEFIGKGLQMFNGLKIASMELYVDAVAIDFGAVLMGNIKLKQSTQATLRVVLTQEDLTASFNTPFVVEKLQKMEYEGQSLQFRETAMKVNDDKTVTIISQVQLGNDAPVELYIIADVEVEARRRIQFVNLKHGGDEAAIQLGTKLMNHVNSMMDLDRFALDGMSLKVDRLRVQPEQIVFYGAAQIDQFPQRR